MLSLPQEVRKNIHCPLKGKLIQIKDNETYEKILGLHIGSYINTVWDPDGEYIFHLILSSTDCSVKKYCISKEKDLKIFTIIA